MPLLNLPMVICESTGMGSVSFGVWFWAVVILCGRTARHAATAIIPRKSKCLWVRIFIVFLQNKPTTSRQLVPCESSLIGKERRGVHITTLVQRNILRHHQDAQNDSSAFVLSSWIIYSLRATISPIRASQPTEIM